MRWPLLILAFLTAACSDRRTFDERYAGTENEIASRANAIEANLAETAPD
jgi:hypothetical protein